MSFFFVRLKIYIVYYKENTELLLLYYYYYHYYYYYYVNCRNGERSHASTYLVVML